jgi:hypothetical protein
MTKPKPEHVVKIVPAEALEAALNSFGDEFSVPQVFQEPAGYMNAPRYVVVAHRRLRERT